MTQVLPLLALVGATLIVVRGGIFAWLRKIGPAMLHCSRCVGFWIGAAAGVYGLAPSGHGRILDAFIVGCATSFLSLLADGVLIALLGEPNEVSSDAPRDR